MTGREILQKLIVNRTSGTMAVKPGPFRVAVDEVDSLAAEVLVFLADRSPELTMGQVQDVLLSALWWQTTLGTMKKAETHGA